MTSLLAWVILTAATSGVVTTSSNPVTVAIRDGGVYWGTWQGQITTAAKLTFLQGPFTVRCRDCYADPLPPTDIYLFGTIQGGMPSLQYYDLSDDGRHGVRITMEYPCTLITGQYIRAHVTLTAKGRGRCDELTILGWRKGK